MEKIFAFGICLYRYRDNKIEVLLCKSALSREKWGFLKGVRIGDETPSETARREFFEESSILVKKEHLEAFFSQLNESKDIGIYLVNFNTIQHGEKYFKDNTLHHRYLSKENSDVQFFSIEQLPVIKKKQSQMTQEIISYLKSQYLLKS